jgi:ATP adenylyltransferase/5',5'''-P-1,P-4-tetraphosphate phosphorylase II
VLLTPRLLWIVSRVANSVISPENETAKIDVNSLGFSGTIFVKNQASLDYLKQLGPQSVLH